MRKLFESARRLFNKQSAAIKFLLIALPPMLFFSFLFLSLIIYLHVENSTAAARHYTGQLADRTAKILAPSLWQFDLVTAETIARMMLDAESVQCIGLSDLSNDFADMRFGVCDAGPFTHVVHLPIRYDEPGWTQEIGQLVLMVDVRTGVSLLDVIWRPTLLLLGLVFVIVASILVGFRVTIQRPVGALIHSMRRFQDTGQRQQVDWSTADEFGTLIAAFNDSIDREEDREAKIRAQLQFRTVLLDTIPHPIAYQDAQGIILGGNAALGAFVAMGPSELVGSRPAALIPDSGWEELAEEALEASIDRPAETIETAVRMPGGDQRSILITVAAYETGQSGGKGAVSFIQDITGRKRNEQALKQAKDEAEQALAQLTLAQQKLVQSEKMVALGQLVAGVAHEINTPLGVGLTSASTLLKQTETNRRRFEDGKLKKKDLETYFEDASGAAKLLMANMTRAADLVQSFKRVAVDQTSEVRRDFSVGECIHDVMLSLHPKLKRTALTVEVACPVQVIMDGYPGAVSQVLTNMIVNSIDHAYEPDQSGQLMVAVEMLEAERVMIRYTDDGKGMTNDVLARIFDPFFTTRRGSGGSGLGMHIVYNIVSRTLGGDITVESAPGVGTCFMVNLPRVAPNQMSGQTNGRTPP